MPGTVTVTPQRLSDVQMIRYSVAWVSDASGDVSGNPITIPCGRLMQIKFIPDGGATAPTTLYDVTLVDANGVDLLAGGGANLSATVSTMVRPTATLMLDGIEAVDLVVAAAGNAKGGTVQLWLQQ